MNTQNLSTLQVLHSSSHKCKTLFLQSCPKEFIRFLCECLKSLLKGNVQLGSKEETFWRPNEGYSSLKLLLLQSLTICLDMDQFVLVPASVYNRSLITQSVIKQELPKYQPSQNPMYQIDSHEKKIKKKFFP